MGLLDKIFNPAASAEQKIREYFEVLTAYQPAFTSFEGSVYEMELTRSIIHSFASHVSKLKPEVRGSGNDILKRRLQFKPNPYMDTTKYLYRLATILMVENNAFIIPLYDDYGLIRGYYPISPKSAEIIDHKGVLYIRFLVGATHYAIEFDRVGIINQFQYENDFFGENNKPMKPTLNLMHTQNEGLIENVKSGAAIRFMAKLANIIKNDDLEKEREKFREMNLDAENSSGVLIFDQKYEDVKQVFSRPYAIDDKQMQQIKSNAFNYFGTNEKILQNNYSSDEWNAYYEGKIEPFAIQASLVHTNMTFSEREIAHGNEIILTSNRLQYLTNNEKLATVTQLFDRGFLTHNEGREIFNMSPVENGDKYFIRKEYAETTKLDVDDQKDVIEESEEQLEI